MSEPAPAPALPVPGSRRTTPHRPTRAGVAAAGRWLSATVQFALVVWLLAALDLEGPAVHRVAALALAGFVVQGLLPASWRLPFFVLLSLSGLALALGPADAAWLAGTGLALVALCHLPVSFGARVALVVAAGAGLGALRAGLGQAPWSAPAWAILGSMFLFRLVLYLFEVRHGQVPRPWPNALAYFFLLPNASFPLFPVVDYRTFHLQHAPEGTSRLREEGVHWMVRGVVHLLLHRLVYYRWALSPEEVETAGKLVQFLVANLLLYLRVSGQFHLIVGLLKMFGFDLPETNRRYFLAASFTDYWRRINIYWKDFMMKVFYYPTFIALSDRGWGRSAALALSTVAVFALSWLLHSYQWFWLRGSFPLRETDAVFWGGVGALVLGGSLLEVRRRKRRRLAPTGWNPARAGLRALRTVGVFAVIAVLWSVWTSDSLAQWTALWRVRWEWDGALLAWFPLGLFAVAFASAGREEGFAGATAAGRGGARVLAAGRVATLSGLVLVAVPGVLERSWPGGGELLAELRESRLGREDAARLERGYYEQVQQVGRFESPLWEIQAQRGEGLEALAEDAALFRERGDFLFREIVPSVRGTYLGKPFTANRWGMRDRDYAREKPPGTYRVALLGGSHVMGHGVADDEIFERLLERRLENEPGEGTVEILNFAINGHSPLQQVVLGEEVALGFAPDSLLYVAHTADPMWATTHLARAVRLGLPLPDPYLEEVVARSGVDPSMTEKKIQARLSGHAFALVDWAYRRLAAACRERDVHPVWIFLPKLKEHGRQRSIPALVESAERAGFTVLNLEGLYNRPDRASLWIGGGDYHPNARGHELIAERLAAELPARREDLLAWGRGAGVALAELHEEPDEEEAP